MTALICGSFAYDTIMVFRDQFKNHLLPDKLHLINVSFFVPEMRREFGGCAGNIAYNLKLLQGDGIALGTVGEDFDAYARWLDQQGIRRDYIRVIENSYTAQAFITTDIDDNQITAFHPGAMSYSDQVLVPTAENLTLAIISPDSKNGILAHAEECVRLGIPFIFDPGQSMPLFNGEELTHLIDKAEYIAVNDYEGGLLSQATGMSLERIAERVTALIVTMGGTGSQIHVKGEILDIPPAKPEAFIDPTGCGDAYRAGVLFGLMKQMDWPTIGRVASLMGAIAITQPGTQNHQFTYDEFATLFKQQFDYDL